MKPSLLIPAAMVACLCVPAYGDDEVVEAPPVGTTQIATRLVAADPVSAKMLVQTYDGSLRVFNVSDDVREEFSGLRVGDAVVLTFDDRVDGDRVVSLSPADPDVVPLAVVLPVGLTMGSPATEPRGTAVAGSVSGVLVPGYASFAALPPGVVSSNGAAALGFFPGVVTSSAGATTTAFAQPGIAANSAITQGSFTPGTLAPGVTTSNRGRIGTPTLTGPFTPGTMTPGVAGPPVLTGAPGNPTDPGPLHARHDGSGCDTAAADDGHDHEPERPGSLHARHGSAWCEPAAR